MNSNRVPLFSQAPSSMSYQELDNVLRRGQFFYPASDHYGNPNTTVNCDKCNTTGIKACIGMGRIDVCMHCVANHVGSTSSFSFGRTADSILSPPPGSMWPQQPYPAPSESDWRPPTR